MAGMSAQVSGNLRGLAPSDLKSVQRLLRRRIAKNEIVGVEFARELYAVASKLGRKVGVLIDREGNIVEVIVGTKVLLYLPELGRFGLARGRLRRLRLIYAEIATKGELALTQDIYTDLEKLRLDLVAVVRVETSLVRMVYAYNIPYREEQPGVVAASVATERVKDLTRLEFDFDEFIEQLEDELASAVARTHRTGQLLAVLVGVYDSKLQHAHSSLSELRRLAETAGVDVVDVVMQRRKPDPKTVVGSGKLEEIILHCLRIGAELLVFDCELRPGQWRAITNATELKVLDRSMLILDIFAQRATSSEGRLQVELAQLQYNLPRLVEKDAGLSRLTGGIGGRGPGETKLEIGRRRIRDRITLLEKRIQQLSKQRSLRRQRRESGGLPQVSILGYTNAGKSTLFNALTRADVLAEDKLFATLDPASRKLRFPAEPRDHTIILSDTVGFIRELPKALQSAFRATLEELYVADLLVHVLDVSDPEYAAHSRAVERIVREMGLSEVPEIVVYNKADALEPDMRCEFENLEEGVLVSGQTKEGLAELIEEIKRQLVNLGR